MQRKLRWNWPLWLRGEPATAAIRPLIEHSDHADQNVRVSAAESLLYFGHESESAVPVLAGILRADRTDLRAPGIRLSSDRIGPSLVLSAL